MIEANHFTEVHRKLLQKVEQIWSKPVAKFCNSDDVNTNTAELRQTKMRPVSFEMIDTF